MHFLDWFYILKIKLQMKCKINYSEVIDFLYAEKKLEEWEIPKQLLLKTFEKHKPNSCWKVFHCLCRLYRDIIKKDAKIFVVKKDGWYSDNAKLLLKIYNKSKILWMIRDLGRLTIQLQKLSIVGQVNQ